MSVAAHINVNYNTLLQENYLAGFYVCWQLETKVICSKIAHIGILILSCSHNQCCSSNNSL
jgi:hypothetical protein